MIRHRIQLIDSFRFIAIASVLLYHFTGTAVHFSQAAQLFPVFKYGYLGVYFFFIISGFVISFTLENTPNLPAFYFNRLARLFPPMLLCSLITFTVVCALDHSYEFSNAHQIRNFLPGLTFTNPNLWSRLLGLEFHWLNGSYWTLWPEVQFYLVSSAIYFLNKKRYAQNILLAGIVIALMKYIPIYILNHYPLSRLQIFFQSWRIGNEFFNLTFFITWFICGTLFFQLYKGLIIHKNRLLAISSLVILFLLVADIRQFFSKVFYNMLIATVIMFVFFLLMIYRDKYLSLLKHPLLYRIGMISYTIYLIHETIGVLLINKYGAYLGRWAILSPFIIAIIVTLFAKVSYQIYEKPVLLFLRKTIFKNHHPLG